MTLDTVMAFINSHMYLMEDPVFMGLYSVFLLLFIAFLILTFKLVRAPKAAPPAVMETMGIPAMGSGVTPAGPAATAPKPAPAPPPPPKTPTAAPSPAAFDKTAILSQSALPSSSPAAGPLSAAAGVDLQMIETVMRRITSLEAEIKKEPLFVDPLIKRMQTLERKFEELLSKSAGGGAAAPASPSLASPEFSALIEKVNGLQKILEHLAEGGGNPQ